MGNSTNIRVLKTLVRAKEFITKHGWCQGTMNKQRHLGRLEGQIKACKDAIKLLQAEEQTKTSHLSN